MKKISFCVRIVGQPPLDLNISAIKKRNSALWEIPNDLETFSLSQNADLEHWGFSDEILKDLIPKNPHCNITFCILNVPLEDNYYSRRISENVVCITFYEIADILRRHNIPLVNAVFRMLYSFSLIYSRTQGKIPPTSTLYKYAHHEARGCIFDMNGIKTDLALSCHEPILCTECKGDSTKEGVSNEFIKIFEKELKTIRKTLFFRATDFIKVHPIFALLISSIFAVFLGTIGSLIASVIYEKYK